MSIVPVDLPVTNIQAADERVFSEAALFLIGDLVVPHVLRKLPAHELIRIPRRIPFHQWSVWSPYNMQQVAEARREDDTRDWYFPISVSSWWPQRGEFIPPERCFTWLGVWHPTANGVARKVRQLPPMTCLLQEWQFAGFPLCDIVASEGGLLLIKARKEVVPVRRSSRTNKHQANSAPSWPPRFDRGRSKDSPVRWVRLLVCNPITTECKELPDMGWKSWHEVYHRGVHVHMEVNDEANSYQVILVLHDFVAVYKSTTDSWNRVRFYASEGPAGFSYPVATALVRTAQLYLADIQSANVLGRVQDDAVEPNGAIPVGVGSLRLFHADMEAGRWRLVHEYRLRWFHMHSLDLHPGDPHRILENVQLVECMGSLYAVIPSWLHNVLTIGEKAISLRDFELSPWNVSSTKGHEHFPRVFNLVRLEGDGEDTAVLRIPDRTESAKNEGGDDSRSRQRLRRTNMWPGQSASWGQTWFTCQVRGSVIWVFFPDSLLPALLSFDVVSRKYAVLYLHSEQTHPSMSHTSDGMSDWSHFSYRPSFHMKP